MSNCIGLGDRASRAATVAEAIKFLHMVPKESAQYPAAKIFRAAFLGTVARYQAIRADHAQTVSGLKTSAEELRRVTTPPKDDYSVHMPSPPPSTGEPRAHRAKGPEATLTVLEGFDDLVKG